MFCACACGKSVRRHDFRDDDFIPRRFGATADGGRALVVPSKIRRKRSYTTLYLFSDSSVCIIKATPPILRSL